MIDVVLKNLPKGAKAGRASLKAGKRTLQGPVPSSLRTDAVSATAKTKEQAIYEGVNKYTDVDGRQRTVRQYDSKHHPLGSAEQTELRQQNRGASTRQERADRQTIGKADFTDGATSRAPHHRLGLAQADPAFEGLSNADVKTMVARIRDKYNVAVGNRSGNRYDLPDDVHTVYHQWEKMHDLKLPSMKGMDLDQRIDAFGEYLNTMAQAGDELIYYLMQHRGKGKDFLYELMKAF